MTRLFSYGLLHLGTLLKSKVSLPDINIEDQGVISLHTCM